MQKDFIKLTLYVFVSWGDELADNKQIKSRGLTEFQHKADDFSFLSNPVNMLFPNSFLLRKISEFLLFLYSLYKWMKNF